MGRLTNIMLSGAFLIGTTLGGSYLGRMVVRDNPSYKENKEVRSSYDKIGLGLGGAIGLGLGTFLILAKNTTETFPKGSSRDYEGGEWEEFDPNESPVRGVGGNYFR